MFAINHAATALVIKKRYPEAPLSLLLISVQCMELLWVGFNFVGIEYSTTEATVSSVLDVHLAHMPYSHSILSTMVVAGFAWLIIRKGLNKPAIAVATAVAIVSHLLLDVLTHGQDIALAPFTDMNKVGLGLYEVPLAAFVVETLYGILCWSIYRGSRSLFAIIVGFNLANITFFSTAISGPEALLADNPVLLTSVVLVQIVLTLVLVGRFSNRHCQYGGRVGGVR